MVISYEDEDAYRDESLHDINFGDCGCYSDNPDISLVSMVGNDGVRKI